MAGMGAPWAGRTAHWEGAAAVRPCTRTHGEGFQPQPSVLAGSQRGCFFGRGTKMFGQSLFALGNVIPTAGWPLPIQSLLVSPSTPPKCFLMRIFMQILIK